MDGYGWIISARNLKSPTVDKVSANHPDCAACSSSRLLTMDCSTVKVFVCKWWAWPWVSPSFWLNNKNIKNIRVLFWGSHNLDFRLHRFWSNGSYPILWGVGFFPAQGWPQISSSSSSSSSPPNPVWTRTKKQLIIYCRGQGLCLSNGVFSTTWTSIWKVAPISGTASCQNYHYHRRTPRSQRGHENLWPTCWRSPGGDKTCPPWSPVLKNYLYRLFTLYTVYTCLYWLSDRFSLEKFLTITGNWGYEPAWMDCSITPGIGHDKHI